jgi:hypothetical protein
MQDQRADFWFPVKRYGWGWGLPVRWQGWVVLVAYFALLFVGIRYFSEHRDVRVLVATLVALTVVLIAVIVAKGERPAGWRWGGRLGKRRNRP